jgi:hypothetical protein
VASLARHLPPLPILVAASGAVRCSPVRWGGGVSLDTDAIRERVEKATPGPWAAHERETSDGHHRVVDGLPGLNEHRVALTQRFANAEFIAHARADIPALLEEVEGLRDERDEAVAHATELENGEAYYRLQAEVQRLRRALDPDVCLRCGEVHLETVLEERAGKPWKTSWLYNDHAYKRRAQWPSEWAALARSALARPVEAVGE